MDPQKRSFEHALHTALSSHGLILPVNDDQVQQLEKEFGTTENLPNEFLDSNFFNPRWDNTVVINFGSDDIDLYDQRVACSDDPDKPEQ